MLTQTDDTRYWHKIDKKWCHTLIIQIDETKWWHKVVSQSEYEDEKMWHKLITPSDETKCLHKVIIKMFYSKVITQSKDPNGLTE